MSPTIHLLRRLVPAAVLGCLPGLHAQSRSPLGDELAKLVPVGTVVYVQAPSINRLATAVRRVTAAFAPEEAEKLDVDKILSDLDVPGSLGEIDHTRPIAMCLVLAEDPGAEPTPTFLVPALSAENYARSLVKPGAPVTTAIEGSYVSVSKSPDSKRGAEPAPIALGLPAGDVVARIDVKRLVEHYRPMIDGSLSAMEMQMASASAGVPGGMDFGAIMRLYADGVRSIVDSSQSLDISVRLDGVWLEIGEALTMLENSALADFGSKEKTDAKTLARFLDPDASMTMVAGMDTVAMTKRFKPLIDGMLAVYPEPMRAGLQKMMGSVDELAAQFGSAMCVSGDFGGAGMRFTYYLHPRDAAKLLAVYKSMMISFPGFAFDEPTQGEVDGVPVTRMRMRIDAKMFAAPEGQALGKKHGPEMQAMFDKMYGKDGLAFTLATKGDVTALVLGGDEAFLRGSLARISSGGKISASVAHALEQVGDLNPCYVLHYNLGKVMHGMSDLMNGAMPEASMAFPEVPASITAWGGVDGRVWRGAMSADLAELGAAVRAMSDQRSGRSQRAKAEADIGLISAALKEYAISNGGKFPDSLEALVTPDVKGATFLAIKPPLRDPWGHEYLYDAPSPEYPTPRVYSYGKDGQPGGDGDDADIYVSIMIQKGK